MARINYVTGDLVGELIFLNRVPSPYNYPATLANFRCSCGKEFVCTIDGARNRKTKSCGCKTRELVGKGATIHGHCTATKKSSEYTSWGAMWSRCTNPNNVEYWRYCNVKICKEWESFPKFLADMGLKPTPKHTIDRYPDKKGNYEPSNCRWATKKQQQLNRTDNRLLEYKGYIKSISEWAELTGLKHQTLFYRIFEAKWDVDRAFTQVTHRGIEPKVINLDIMMSKTT